MYGYLLLRIKNRRIFVQSGGECCALAKIGRVDRRVWMLGGEVRKDDGTKVRERKRTREQKCERAKVQKNRFPGIMYKRGIQVRRIFLWLTGGALFSKTASSNLSSAGGFARDRLDVYRPYGGFSKVLGDSVANFMLVIR